VREYRLEFELPGNMPDIFAITPEINVFACEGHAFPQFRFVGQVTFRPIINSLSADQDIRKSRCIPNLKNFRELSERETVAHRSGPLCHRPGHLAQVGDPPPGPVTHQRDLTLTRHCRA